MMEQTPENLGRRGDTFALIPLLMVPAALFLYIFFLLVFNVDRGFDITDESFYILWSRTPRDVSASITQFGHYTGILYALAGGSLAGFRLMGLLLLLAASGLFWHALERFWHSLGGGTVAKHSRWLSLSVILASALVHYRSWLLTPSYNWLALVATLLVASGLLYVAVRAGATRTGSSDNVSFLLYGLLVGTGGGLSFVAKPTTAAVLAIIFLGFIGFTSLRSRWKVFTAGSIVSACFFIILHAIAFENGLSSFYAELKDGLMVGELVGSGHTIKDVLLQACGDIKDIPDRLVNLFPLIYAGLAFLLMFFTLLFKRYRNIQSSKLETIFTILLLSVSVAAWVRLWKTGYWAGGASVSARIGFGELAFSLVLFFSSLLTLPFRHKENPDDENCHSVHFTVLVKLYIFFILLAVAYAFGSANGLLRQMSGGFVFLSAASLYIAFWIDQHTGKRYLGYVISLLIIISVCLVMTSAYERPYRLPAGIGEQVTPIAFLGNNEAVRVDEKTAEYMSNLKKIAHNAGWKVGMSLIDMTGGTPGAAVILGGRAPGIPWLAGGYEGSYDTVRVILSKVSFPTLQSSWVLVAPSGRRKISSDILTDLGLNFPSDYKAVGEVRTGYRNEAQVLWRPLDGIPSRD